MDAVEARTIAKVSKRLVPFLIVCYFIAYLDRVNVSFSALTMNQDLGLTQTAYGLGAGIFFIAYFIFEVPSNLMLERFGARKWIARIEALLNDEENYLIIVGTGHLVGRDSVLDLLKKDGIAATQR